RWILSLRCRRWIGDVDRAGFVAPRGGYLVGAVACRAPPALRAVAARPRDGELGLEEIPHRGPLGRELLRNERHPGQAGQRVQLQEHGTTLADDQVGARVAFAAESAMRVERQLLGRPRHLRPDFGRRDLPRALAEVFPLEVE